MIINRNVLKNIILLVAVFFLGIVLYFVSYNEKALTTNTFLFSMTAILPILIAYIFALKYGMGPNNKFNINFGIGMGIASLCIALLFFCYSYFNSTAILFATFITNILIFFMVIVALTFLFNVFSNYINKTEGTSKFILQFIFYIPCLLNNLFEYLKYQFQITPSITYILLFLEIILIIIYLYVPMMISKMILPKGHILQKGQFFFNDNSQMVTISDSKITLKNKEDLLNNGNPYRKTYSISMWIQINPSNNINKEQIFSYGYKNTNQNINYTKPMIKYSYDNNTGKDVYNIYFISDVEDPIQINLPNQKWNQFVFNYNTNNTADLFINGSLERTFDMRNKQTDYSLEDTFTIGSNNSLLYGSISNVIYYDHVLTSNAISNLYLLGQK